MRTWLTAICFFGFLGSAPGLADDLKAIEARFAAEQNAGARGRIASEYANTALQQGRIAEALAFLDRRKAAPDADGAMLLLEAQLNRNSALDAQEEGAWLVRYVEQETHTEKALALLSRLRGGLPAERRSMAVTLAVRLFEKTKDEVRRRNIFHTALSWASRENDRRPATEFIERTGSVPDQKWFMTLWNMAPRSPTDYRTGPWLTPFFARGQANWRHIQNWFDHGIPRLSTNESRRLLAALSAAVALAEKPADRVRIGNQFLHAAGLKGDTQSVFAFLEDHRERFEKENPVSYAVWKTRARILARDKPGAEQALDRAIALASDKAGWVEGLRHAIHNMSTQEYGPAIEERDTQQALDKAAAHAARGQIEDLHRLIRDTLENKGQHAIRNRSDMRLFDGVNTWYRKAFADYADSYSAYVDSYAKAVRLRGGYDAEAAARLREKISLDRRAPRPGLPIPELDTKDLTPDRTATNFLGCVELSQGAFEMESRQTYRSLGGPDPEFFSRPLVADGRIYAQTSVGMVCMEEDRVVWARGFPPTTIWNHPYPPKFAGAPSRPATVGPAVVGRYATDRGQTLIALDRETGTPLWSYVPHGARLTGDPAEWQGRVVAQGLRTGHHGAPTMLFVVNARSGREEARYLIGWEPAAAPLWAKQPARGGGYENRYTHVSYAENMPAPVVAGDTAYLQPHSGIAAAFDLRRAELIWLRIYRREESQIKAAPRLPSEPVVGADNVLLTAMDGSALTLVQRENGQVVFEDTATLFRETASAGRDVAAVVSTHQVRFYSLQDYTLVAEHKESGLRVLQELADGCAFYNERHVLVFNARGEEVGRYPRVADSVPVAAGGGRVYAFSRRHPGLFGVWSRGTGASLTPAAAAIGAPIGARRMPQWMDDGNESTWHPAIWEDGFVEYRRDYAAYMTPSGRRWDVPLMRRAHMFRCGERLAVLHFGAVDFYDRHTGRWTHRWPAWPDARRMNVRGLAPSNGRLYARVHDRREAKPKAELYRFDNNGESARTIRPDTLNHHGRFAVAGDGRQLIPVHTRGPDGTQLTVSEPYRSDRVWRSVNSSRTVQMWGGAGSEQFVIPGEGELWPRIFRNDWPIFDRFGVKNGILHFAQMKEHRQRHYFFYRPETRQGYTLTANIRDELPYWAIAGQVVYGLRMEWGTGRGVMLDFSGTGAPVVKEGATETFPILFGSEKHARFERAASALLGNTVMHSFLLKEAWGNPLPVRLALQKKGSPDIRQAIFPHFTSVHPVSERMALINGIATDETAFWNILEMAKNMTRAPCLGKGPAFLDGFPDEWQDAEFSDAPHGRWAVRAIHGRHRRQPPDRVWIALEISRPDLVRKLARPGATDLIALDVGLGTAGYEWNEMTRTTFRPAQGDSPGRFAFSVAPDGSRFYLEAATRISHSRSHALLRRPGTGPGEIERALGDLAVRVLWRATDWDEWVGLLDDRTEGPLSFRRAILDMK